jgi:hypothetical protein
MKVISAVAAPIGIILSSCAIVPLPDDVVGIDVAQITAKIRCEVRDDIKKKLIVTLIKEGAFLNDTEAVRIGNQLQNGERTPQNVDLNSVGPIMKAYLAAYAKTAIAYNFTLDGTITNNLNQGTLNAAEQFGGYNAAKQLVSDGTRMIGFSGGVTATRDNIVTFSVSDVFFTLLRKIPDDYCTDKSINANYLYPIAGNLGLYKIIDEFVDLNSFGNLAAPDPKTPTGPPTLTWTMTFTTGLTASATPQITLSPITNVSRVTQGAITGTVGRTDKHTLAVALSREVKEPTAAEEASIFSGQLLTLSGTAEQKNALLALQQATLQNYYLTSNQRPVVIVNPSLIPGLF